MYSILGEITAQITQLMSGSSPQLAGFAWNIFNSIAVFQLVMICIRWELDLMDNHHWTRFHLSAVVLFLMKIAAVSIMLTFYSSPLPGFGVSFHQLLPLIGQKLAASVDQSGDALVTTNLNLAVARLPTPSALSPIETLTYLGILMSMAWFQLLLFVVTAFGFIGVAVLSLTGYLMIPLLLTKNFARYFWTWLDMMVVYSLYPFIAAAFIFVLGNSLNNFFARVFAGAYSFPELIVALPVLLVLLGTFTFCIFKIPQFASQHFGGAGAVSSNISGAIESFVHRSMRA